MNRLYAFLLICCIPLLFVQEAKSQFVTEKAIDSTQNAEIEEQKMIITVIDKEHIEPIKADVIIKGLNPRKPVVFEGITDSTIIFKTYRLYTVSVVKEGYMYYAHKFWPDESFEHKERIELEPLKVGLKTSVQDITFLGDQTEIYHKSTPALEELIRFLEINPNVKICLIGHANGPESEKKGPAYYKKASEKRAMAVRDFLIQHGIAPERLATRGAGNTQMLYPDPQTDWETQANRRIEIEVIGL
jgi:outer membrane protein OmpA-like peptidoglycan-associated protein